MNARILIGLGLWAAWATLQASAAQAAICTGKQNGLWCDGNNLVTCKNGAQTASQACPNGCQSMPVGVADQCKSASGPCAGKQDGAWCDGGNLLQCKGGAVASSQACTYGCDSKPVGVPDSCKSAPQPSGPCAGKQDGAYCDGSNLLQCKGGSVGSSQSCPNGCDVKPPGTPDVCKADATTPCTGKSDGAWCSGDQLLQCSGGKVAAQKACTYGCQAMPPGQPDQCKGAPPANGPCSGKSDGQWCDGGNLLTCSGGKAANSATCKNGCQAMPTGVADQCKPDPAPSGPCSGLSDGTHCSGSTLLVCKDGQKVGDKACLDGCANQGGADACTVPPFDPMKACAGKSDGAWCVGSELALCKGGQVASAANCPAGCQPMPNGIADTCKKPGGDPACAGKGDGTYCIGGDIIWCASGVLAKGLSCAKGCAEPAAGSAACKVKAAGFCSGKDDGAWCDGPLLTQCQTGSAASVFACPGGCQPNPPGTPDQCKAADTPSSPTAPSGTAKTAESGGCATFSGSIDLWGGKGLKVWNQKDFTDQLGTCPGLTIHNSGCTITSLAMLHAYLGIVREVDGQKGNDPPTENQWRGKFGGYAATSYQLGGKPVAGKCLVIWTSAPAGLVPAHAKNPSTTCIAPNAATFIVNALKAGMPVVAGVHWPGGNATFYGTSEDWHWVLIVGVDGGGPLINDPWGGKERVHLADGGLGSYVLDDLYVFWQPGQQQGGMSAAPLGEDGEPTTEDGLPKTLQYIDETPPTNSADAQAAGPDAGATAPAAADGSADAARSPAPAAPAAKSGCAATPLGQSLWPLAFLAVGWYWKRRKSAATAA